MAETNKNGGKGVNNYFKTKIKNLENENNQLKSEILKLTNDKNTNIIEYYLRLRTDLINEIENLTQSNEYEKLNYMTEKKRLEGELENLTSKLLEITKEKNELQLQKQKLSRQDKNENDSSKFGTSKTISEQYIPTERDTIVTTMRNAMNTASTENEETDNKTKNKNEFTFKKIKKEIIISDEKDEKILSLEEQIRSLQGTITQLEFNEKDYKNKITQLENQIESITINSKDEISSWKTKYNSILTANKSLCSQYEEVLETKIKNYKKEMETNKYELEKKIINLEKLLVHKENDIKSLSEMNLNFNAKKDEEINSLKNQIKTQQSNYEIMFKLYNDHLQKMTNNLNNMKKLYFTRETEFINITNYYINLVNEYSKPLNDNNEVKNKIEKQFHIQSNEIIDLHNQVESLSKEINDIQNDNLDYKPKMRMKLTQTIKAYDEQIKQIVNVHKDLGDNLKILTEFSKKIDDRLNLFNSIIEDNKSLTTKNNVLESKLKMYDTDGKDKEIAVLKELNMKMQKELDVKNQLLSEYDEMFKHFDTKTASPYDEVIIKLKGEISRLNAQVLNLTKCKDTIEKYYQNELKNLLNKLSSMKLQNEELMNTIKKMENDYMGKKETLLNLWMLEFQEFKDNLLSVESIQNIINNFSVQGNELTKHKEYLCNEELFQLRQEIKGKDDAFESLKKIHADEILKKDKIINNYKTTIDNKVKTFEELISNKKKEIDALTKDTEEREKFNVRREELNKKEMENWEEQKKELEKISHDQMELKQGQVFHLKEEISHLEKEISTIKSQHDTLYIQTIQQFEEQMKLIKDREDFTIKQLENLQDQFDTYKEEKERVIKVLKIENQQLTNLNLLLSNKQKN